MVVIGAAASAIERTWQQILQIDRSCRSGDMRPMSVKRLLQTNGHVETGVVKTAEWVRQELRVRLAHRLRDFHTLPFLVIANPYIRSCYDITLSTFNSLLKVPPIHSSKEKDDFVRLMKQEMHTHDTTVDLMGKGVRQLRFAYPSLSLDGFLERFFFFRIGRRIMIEHLLSLHNPKPGWTGCINLNCSPSAILADAADLVTASCRHSYGMAPKFSLGGDLSVVFPFIPNHLSLVVTEILKNAMRATVEYQTLGSSVVDRDSSTLIIDESDLPDVTAEVYKGRHDVVIKISDKGGGILPAKVNDCLRFGWSTVSESNEKLAQLSRNGWIRPDMAGYGFGLPLARVFTKYFGGDIHLQPCFGVGTDVFVTLNHIGDHEEPLDYLNGHGGPVGASWNITGSVKMEKSFSSPGMGTRRSSQRD